MKRWWLSTKIKLVLLGRFACLFWWAIKVAVWRAWLLLKALAGGGK